MAATNVRPRSSVHIVVLCDWCTGWAPTIVPSSGPVSPTLSASGTGLFGSVTFQRSKPPAFWAVSPHAAGMGSLLVANTSIGPDGVFTVRTMAPSPCRVFGAAGRNESCRGWRGLEMSTTNMPPRRQLASDHEFRYAVFL